MIDYDSLHELEMAKKRDRKIAISEEAINKVPRIQYKGIPEKEYDNVCALAKEVLRISRDQNDSNEVAITYSLESARCIERNEEYLGIALGSEHGVDPLSNTTSNHLINGQSDCVVVVLHNHPSLSDFSLSDIYFFLAHGSIKMMVVVSNLGRITYLTKQEKYNYAKAVALLNEAISMHNEAKNLKDLQDAADNFLRNSFSVGITYDDR